MRIPAVTLLAVLILDPAPALAGQQAQQKTEAPETPITEQKVTAKDVAATPVTDLNLKKGEIPQLLLDAQEEPYTLKGMKACGQITVAVNELDAMLGDDVDIAQAKNGKVEAGRVAQSVVGSFIPFRGVIREVSGANSYQRRLQAAITAGMARRAFLKGIGQQRGCAWPARSAPPEMIAKIEAEAEVAAKAAEEEEARKEAEKAAKKARKKRR